MVRKFERVMVKLATLGHNPNSLVDCSDVIPVPAAVRLPVPTLPAGKSLADVQAAVCNLLPWTAGAEILIVLHTVRGDSLPEAQCCPGSRDQRRTCVSILFVHLLSSVGPVCISQL